MALTILFVLYCVEAGLFFTFAPWTKFWAFHPLLHWNDLSGMIADNPYFRGFVSGLGVVHFILGFQEIRIFRKSRRPVR